MRGHSNIQGLTDLGLMSNLLPGYLTLADGPGAGLRHLHVDARLQAATAGPDELLAELQEVLRQLPEVDVRAGGDGGERLGLRLAAEARRARLRRAARVRADAPGQGERLLLPGLQPAAVVPEPREDQAALSKLKFLVVMDPLQTETARFWENHGEHNVAKPEEIQTEVFELPTTCFAEDEGSLTNSGRWLQWHWAGATPPGEAKSDAWIMAQLYQRLKALYQKEGGTFPDADPQPALALQGPGRSDSRPSSPRRSTATSCPTCPILPTRPRSCCRRASRW